MSLNNGDPPPCPRCGGPQGALFQSFFCKRDCDRAPQGAVKPEHKMNLGYDWVLWTENETPPFGWTHVTQVLNWPVVDTIGWDIAGTSRPHAENVARGTGRGPWYWMVNGMASTTREDDPRLKGITYKVPK